MRALAWIILILLGFCAIKYLFTDQQPLLHTDVVTPHEQPKSPSSSVPVPSSTPFVPTVPPPMDIAGLLLVRGRVEAVTPDGIIIECEQPAVGGGFQWRAPANAGAGDIARMASLAAAQQEKKEQDTYGRLLSFQNGVLRQPEFTPDKAAEGVVLVRDHPNQRSMVTDQRFKVVAAPTGDIYTYRTTSGREYRMRVYTMSYKLTPAAAGAWMWNRNRSNPLDRDAHR